jgi:hypothetical protein
MKNVNTLFQKILGAHGVQSLDAIMNAPEEATRQKESAEQYAAHIAEMRARLDNHEHVIEMFKRK